MNEKKWHNCIVNNCVNAAYEGLFIGKICEPCYKYLVLKTGEHSQAYRNDQNNEENLDEAGQIHLQKLITGEVEAWEDTIDFINYCNDIKNQEK